MLGINLTYLTFLKVPLCFNLSVQPVQFSRSVMSDSLRPHESQHARPPCPSPTPRVLTFRHLKITPTLNSRNLMLNHRYLRT